MGQNFYLSPDPNAPGGPAAERTFVVAPGIDPIIRLFLTATLAELNLNNLRPFMRADQYGPGLYKL